MASLAPTLGAGLLSMMSEGRMAKTADTREILEAIRKSDDRTLEKWTQVAIALSGLQEKVGNLGEEVSRLSIEIKQVDEEKASVKDLNAVENRIGDKITAVQADAAKDVEGFERMYESLVQEIKEGRDCDSKERKEIAQELREFRDIESRERRSITEKLDTLVAYRSVQEEKDKNADSVNETKLKSLTERIEKLEPLRDVWLRMLGAKWTIGIISGIAGALILILLKYFLHIG